MKIRRAILLVITVLFLQGCFLDELWSDKDDNPPATDRQWTRDELIPEKRQEDGSWK